MRQDDARQTVRVTHPFHPLRGREFRFVYAKHCWGLERVFCEGQDGQLRAFPTAWTDMAAEDPFVTVSAGRSAFRVADLLELADLLDRTKAGGGEGV